MKNVIKKRGGKAYEDFENVNAFDLKWYSAIVNGLQKRRFLNFENSKPLLCEMFNGICMKKKYGIKFFISVLFFMTTVGFCQKKVQNADLKTTFFSLTPRNHKVDKVNGMAFGVGLNIFDVGTLKTVNGFNVELNPLIILYFMFANPSEFSEESTATINGLHISTGNINNIQTNGLAISILNIGYASNGISLNGFSTRVTQLNGLHISGFANSSKLAKGCFISLFNVSESCNGFQLGLYNHSSVFKGVQIGVINGSENTVGVQIGLFNLSKKHKGLQIGFWNINNKRSMPFINW